VNDQLTIREKQKESKNKKITPFFIFFSAFLDISGYLR